MINKVLFCATVDYHFESFHLPHMKWFQEKDWEVHVAANGDINLPFVKKKYNIPIQRSPFNVKNIKAFQQLKEIIDENNYRIVHCHTPMGGVLARLASFKARKNVTKVIYTAHGFHFCNGSPLLNWIVYYPIERYLARHTDCLITINQEDYQRAVNHKFRARDIKHVHGVGVDTEKFRPITEEIKHELRREKGYQEDDFIMFYAAEFNKNKNQQLLIKVMGQIKEKISNARLLLAGEGELEEYCRNLAVQLEVDKMVEFLGYRNDIAEILPMCDLAVASSIREGLPVNIMEGMACGLPVIASSNRGHCELVTDGVNGFIINNSDLLFSERILELYKNPEQRLEMGKKSVQKVIKYEQRKVNQEMGIIYKQYML